MKVHKSSPQIKATARLHHKSSFIARVDNPNTVVIVVSKTGLNLALITSKINSSLFLYFLFFSLLYLSIKSIASFTHTHIKPNIQS
jgi:hypothetical protein